MPQRLLPAHLAPKGRAIHPSLERRGLSGPSTVTLQSTGQLFEGTLNRNIQYRDQAGNLYLLRVPKQETPIKADLAVKYPEQGFAPPRGFHRYRSIAEQFTFMKQALAAGLEVLEPTAIARDATTMIVPFLQEAIPLDVYLHSGRTEAVPAVLDNLLAAHQKGLVFGDRWGTNTLVIPEGMKEIDFDIAFEGSRAKEFELGKLLYHIVHFSSERDTVLTVLHNHFEQHKAVYTQQYNLPMVRLFIANHFKMYGGKQTVAIDTIKELGNPPVNAEQVALLLTALAEACDSGEQPSVMPAHLPLTVGRCR